MILATLAIGFACLLAQQAAHAIRQVKFNDLDHAGKIFPHPNEKTRPFQKRLK
jgi:hypothetical protein